jgi:hypothetical protein
MTDNIPETFSHRTLTEAQWRAHLKQSFGGRFAKKLPLRSNYVFVEYLSAPQGLIVLAHRDDPTSQVDGIHPVSLSMHVDDDRNIVEPLVNYSTGYAVHYLTRKQHGGLVLGAYDRMIQPRSKEAPCFEKEDGGFHLELYCGKFGPIVGVLESPDIIHVIERDQSVALENVAA